MPFIKHQKSTKRHYIQWKKLRMNSAFSLQMQVILLRKIFGQSQQSFTEYLMSFNDAISSFSKILARIMCNRIYKHLKSNNLLFDKKFGFQLKNSTKDLFLQLINDLFSSFERREYTLEIFIDLSKSFDTVDHKMLIS